MLLNQKSPPLPRNLALGTFGELLVGKSAVSPLFKSPEVLSSASDKTRLFPKSFLILMTWVSVYLFSPGTNLKLHISITHKMVKKVITNLDSSKASGPDCIPVVVP